MKKNLYLKKNKVYCSNTANNKEYFRLIINYLERYKSNISLLDVGCASGDFLSLLSKKKNLI